jgi:hypothetical protein
LKREAKRLLSKSTDALVLAIELFNRPHDIGRHTATLILLDHAMEMLLKAAILQRGGRISDPAREGNTIGFDSCVGRGLSEGRIRFLNDDQAKLLRMINGQRDAAQHYLNEISEELLYSHMQGAVTLAQVVTREVFRIDLNSIMPRRVLPISTVPPTDLHVLFDRETRAIQNMLRPGGRKRVDAEARLRPLMIVERALAGGDVQQPSPNETAAAADSLNTGTRWQDVFPGVASLQYSEDADGFKIAHVLRKKGDGIPVALADSDIAQSAEGLEPVLYREVSDFDRFSLMQKDLGRLLSLNNFAIRALIWKLGIKDDPAASKTFSHGKMPLRRYSQVALNALRTAVSEGNVLDYVEEFKRFERDRNRRPK